VRDAVLGVTLLDGRGGIGRFGGQVMKNVAGYDVARLNVGAMGSLGVLLDVSLRLQPRPVTTVTRLLELGLGQACECMATLGRRPLPITAMAWEGGVLRVRLAGSEAGVTAALATVGGVTMAAAEDYWTRLRDRRLPLFDSDGPLWRLSLPATAPQPELSANWLLDWAGAQRWCCTDAPPERVFEAASSVGGHAMRLAPSVQRSALPPVQLRLQQRIKAVFDPLGLFNPGVLYPGEY
jgi:glycolate oxidase FAD binding subunit